MYYYRAIFKFFCDVNLFNLVFCLFMSQISGFGWSLFLFNTIGIWIGLRGYHIFKRNEYYMYANLGLSKPDLILTVFLMNVAISLPLLFLVLVFL